MKDYPAPERRSRTLLAATLAVGMLIVGGAAAQPLPLPSVQWRPLLTIYGEDFETGDGGYITGGTTSFAHGAVIAPPLPAAGQGPTMWATNPNGNYSDSECGFVQSAPIDLSAIPDLPEVDGVTLARLSYRHWLHTESRWDGGIVAVSSDGVNYTLATPIGGYDQPLFTTARTCLGLGTTDRAYSSAAAPAADGWSVEQFDVTSFLGGALHVRWLFASDADTNHPGWYVDDVAVQLGVAVNVQAEVPPPPEPPFTTLSPVYQEDFEAGDGGWSATGTATWEWGDPASPPVPPSGSLKLWGTHLLGDYLDNECAALTSPPIELPGVGAGGLDTAKFTMKLWRHTERLYDGAVLQASDDDGATWSILTPDGGYDIALSTSSLATPTRTCLGVTTTQPVWTGPATQPAPDAYLSVSADVSDLLGSTVRFRIVFGSEASVVGRGVYIDDAAVLVGAGVRPPNPDDPAAACGTAPGWTVAGTNPSWCYGPPTTGPASTKPVYATNLDGQHNASECSTLTSPAIDTQGVPGLGQLTLGIEHFMDTASTLDGGVVQVSTDDGASWSTVTPIGGYNSSLGTDARNCISSGSTSMSGWSGGFVTGPQYVGRQFRLTSFEGQTIRVRFIFGASASTHDFGWYVRAVSLTKGAGFVPLLP